MCYYIECFGGILMSDLTIQLLRLINEGKTLNEISEILNISHKKIFNYLTMI